MDDEIILATVAGDQTEALVGAQGSVWMRYTRCAARCCRGGADTLPGYGSISRVAPSDDARRCRSTPPTTCRASHRGGEIMLEPMNASDRKVIHDAI